MSKNKLKIRKGDFVEVITGNDKGKKGNVLEIFSKTNRALVKDVRLVSKHIKPSATSPKGGINKIEASIHISNLMLIDESSGDKSRVGRKLNDKGKLQRFFKKSGKFI